MRLFFTARQPGYTATDRVIVPAGISSLWVVMGSLPSCLIHLGLYKFDSMYGVVHHFYCSCMWITYLSTKSAFLSLEELLNIAIALVPVPSRCLRYAHLKWLLTVLGCQRARPRLICVIHVVRWSEVSRSVRIF